jgi:hypothetical protein
VGAVAPPDASNVAPEAVLEDPEEPVFEPAVEPVLYVGPTPASFSRPEPALSCEVSDEPSWASRASASTAGASLVAFEVSVLLVLVECEGCLEAAAFGLPSPKWPEPDSFRESAASESEVTTPTASALVWSLVT